MPSVSPPRHVLLIRTDHLGDMLLTLPMVPALKAAWPTCRVSVLASPANAAAAQHHPAVDHVEIDPLEAKGSGLRGIPALARQLRALGCDAAVVVHATPRLALALVLAGVPVRIGTAYRAYSFLFNRRVRQHRRRPPWKHEAESNVELLRPLGIDAGVPGGVMWMVSPNDAAAVAALVGADTARAMVVLHPGNAGSAMNWAPAQYAELGTRLAATGARIAVTGGPDETGLTAEVAGAIGGALDLGGRLTLPQLAALLQRSAVYVGSATGPTHLAAAVGIPVLALYSPLRSSAPQRWRPLGAQVTVVQPAVDLVCPTCLGPRCPYYHCMQRHLHVDAIERLAHAILAARGSAEPPQSHPPPSNAHYS